MTYCVDWGHLIWDGSQLTLANRACGSYGIAGRGSEVFPYIWY